MLRHQHLKMCSVVEGRFSNRSRTNDVRKLGRPYGSRVGSNDIACVAPHGTGDEFQLCFSQRIWLDLKMDPRESELLDGPVNAATLELRFRKERVQRE
jgi:hypothetical protein